MLTDTMHSSSLKQQTQVLYELLRLPASTDGFLYSAQEVQTYIANNILLGKAANPIIDAETRLKTFGNLSEKQVEIFVLNLFNKLSDGGNGQNGMNSGNGSASDSNADNNGSSKRSTMTDAFQVHIKDFLIQLKIFGGEEEEWENARQQAIQQSQQMQQQQ